MDLLTKAANNTDSKKNKPNNFKIIKIICICLGILIIIGLIGLTTVYFPIKKLLSQVDLAKTEVANLQQSVNDKDLDQAQTNLNNLQKQVQSIESTYKTLQIVGSLPFINSYYHDGQNAIKIAYDSIDTGNILIKAVEPYKDFLGIKGAATSSAKTTEDRIAFLTQSVEGLLPYFDTIDSKVSEIETSLNQINASRYPENFKGIQLKSNILKAQDLVDQAHQIIENDKPMLSKISWLLGKDSPRKYLMIFQNDNELRPSGGFWTAYSTITVSNGKVIPGTASNIYDLDDKLNSHTPAPRIIKTYHINVPYLYLRDSNLSPDFPTDAQIFLDQYTKAMGKKDQFDAVIAIDTNVLVDMVKILGKLDTRVGTFTADPDKRCYGCPSIIYDLEWISGRPRNFIEKNRKDFMNPLMSALLSNIMGSEKTKMPLLIQAFFKNINEKLY